MGSEVEIVTLSNGLTVIYSQLPHLRSFSYSLLIPGGLLADPQEHQGAALILSELFSRGAAGLDSRALSDLFDSLGISHSESVNEDYYSFGGSCLETNAGVALKLLADLVLRPTLPAEEIESIRSLLLQEIRGLADNPARRAFQEFDRIYYPAPYNRSEYGSEAGLNNSDIEAVTSLWKKMFNPEGAVLSLAGSFDPKEIKAVIEQQFGSWSGSRVVQPKFPGFLAPQYSHIQEPSAQVQIVLAYPSAKFADSDYYVAKVATEILAGGFCGRLFTEVREKRGLCYSVHASHSSTPEYGVITGYAGTTTDRAQETLDVMLEVLNGMSGTVNSDELARAKANLLTGLTISHEPSRATAGAHAIDYAYGQKVRTVDQIRTAIKAVTPEDIDRYVAKYSPSEFGLLTLGAKQLELSKKF